ncbi:hypothetical protein ACFTOW_11300 [Lacimonas salitolerans]|uniref:Uncharacterized protein n=1 Tax=Lacimonas salitolerans TaxID=1323750 RepID=A0ABW4EF58_9RHOB
MTTKDSILFRILFLEPFRTTATWNTAAGYTVPPYRAKNLWYVADIFCWLVCFPLVARSKREA